MQEIFLGWSTGEAALDDNTWTERTGNLTISAQLTDRICRVDRQAEKKEGREI